MRKQWLVSGGVVVLTGALIAMVARPAAGRKDCDALRDEIHAKLEAKGVKRYSLDIVENADVAGRKVVGSCDGGTKKIVYSRE
jgi:hypothetical protein